MGKSYLISRALMQASYRQVTAQAGQAVTAVTGKDEDIRVVSALYLQSLRVSHAASGDEQDSDFDEQDSDFDDEQDFDFDDEQDFDFDDSCCPGICCCPTGDPSGRRSLAQGLVNDREHCLGCCCDGAWDSGRRNLFYRPRDACNCLLSALNCICHSHDYCNPSHGCFCNLGSTAGEEGIVNAVKNYHVGPSPLEVACLESHLDGSDLLVATGVRSVAPGTPGSAAAVWNWPLHLFQQASKGELREVQCLPLHCRRMHSSAKQPVRNPVGNPEWVASRDPATEAGPQARYS